MTSCGNYVGRVGGLAVALGIGAAIASGQGVASADSSGSPSKPPDSSESPKTSPESPKLSPSSAGVAADAAAEKSAGGGVEGNWLSVPSLRPWSGQGYGNAVAGRDGFRLSRHLSTDDDTTLGKPLDNAAVMHGLGTGAPAGGETWLWMRQTTSPR